MRILYSFGSLGRKDGDLLLQFRDAAAGIISAVVFHIGEILSGGIFINWCIFSHLLNLGIEHLLEWRSSNDSVQSDFIPPSIVLDRDTTVVGATENKDKWLKRTKPSSMNKTVRRSNWSLRDSSSRHPCMVGRGGPLLSILRMVRLDWNNIFVKELSRIEQAGNGDPSLWSVETGERRNDSHDSYWTI